MPVGLDQTRGPESVVFQGQYGAYAHIACRNLYPNRRAVAMPSFRQAMQAVANGNARFAVIPVENTVAGRVADLHTLLPSFDLPIVGESFQTSDLKFLAVPGTELDRIRRVRSHVHALLQCRSLIDRLGLETVIDNEAATAAKKVADSDDGREAAIASALAADIYGLDILLSEPEDSVRNTTRFLIFAREPSTHDPKAGPSMTSLLITLAGQPAALFKVLGAFATNAINVTKLESYLVNQEFDYSQFFVEVTGHPDEPHLARALNEVAFHADTLSHKGTYPADPARFSQNLAQGLRRA